MERNYDCTNLLSSLERVIRDERDGDEVLVRVDESVRDGDDRRVVEGQGDSCDGLDTREEAANELILIDVENGGREHVAVVEDLDDGHTIGERRDVQHVEQRRLGGSDTGTRGDDLDVRDDFNRTTGDLGGDVQGLEEGGLARLHTGVTGGNDNVLGRERTGTRGRSDLVGNDRLADFLEVLAGEDEADVALDVGEETLELRVLGEDRAECAANHGVLAHQDDTLATEGNTNLMHLVGTDIVDIDQEDGSLTR